MFLSIFASAPCEFAPPLLEVFRFFSNLVAHESTVRLVSVVLQVKTPIEYRVRSPCKKADGKMSPPAANLYFQLLLYFLRFGHLHFCTSSPGRHHPVKEIIHCTKKAFLKKSVVREHKTTFKVMLLERKRNRLLYSIATSGRQLVVKEVGKL